MSFRGSGIEMRIFICSYGGFFLAIPMSSVLSIFLFSGEKKNLIYTEPENGSAFISLPVFLKYDEEKTFHGIILKPDAGASENKIILLSTEILCEREIRIDSFYPVPKSLSNYRGFSVFSGMFFIPSGGSINKYTEDFILLLNPKHLVKLFNKELLP